MLQLPLTREGINTLIEICREARDTAETSSYYQALVNKLDKGQLEVLRSARIIKLADVIVTAGEFVRPKLRNGESLGGIGKIYYQGLSSIGMPSHSYIAHCRELIQVTPRRRLWL